MENVKKISSKIHFVLKNNFARKFLRLPRTFTCFFSRKSSREIRCVDPPRKKSIRALSIFDPEKHLYAGEIHNFRMNCLVFRETSYFFCGWNCRGGPERHIHKEKTPPRLEVGAGGHFCPDLFWLALTCAEMTKSVLSPTITPALVKSILDPNT